MIKETVTPVDRFDAPFGREVVIQDVLHESGMRMLRIRIREGKRFTIMDVDAKTASHWGSVLAHWAEQTDQLDN